MEKKTEIFSNIEKGLQKNLISFNKKKTQIIYYIKKSYTTSFKNPEEQVRAAFFCKLVLNYLYPAERIQFEVPTKPDKDRIDILVYKDNELKEPYIVVECKKEGISDAEFNNAVEQAFRYANYKRSHFAVVVAGNRIEQYLVEGFKSGERTKNIISDIPVRYEDPPKYKYYKEKGRDLNIVPREELIKAFEKCHDIIWQGGKLPPTNAFDKFSKLLFCKLKDEKSTIQNKRYDFQIGTNESPAEVFQRIIDIYQNAKDGDEEVFKEKIDLDPEVVFSCVKHLQHLAITRIDLDAKGIAFEKFMHDFFKGKMGQFFTPRNIVKFVVEMIQPNSYMFILDPACGSGGFLLESMDYVKVYAEKNYIDPREIQNHWRDFAKDRLFGVEINDQISRVCKMNMILHEDGHANIINTDSLKNIKYLQSLNKKLKKNNFDLILTNPPFGAMVKDGEKEYLKRYTLGKIKHKVRQTQKTEILFIERCIEFLKPGIGKMAIVLPDGILNNGSLQYVREYILSTCQILAVVSLPQMAFNHYGAAVKSSLLFIRKKEQDEELGNYPIFMAIAEHIGYDATGRETPNKNDLSEILMQYKQFEQGYNFNKQNNIFLVNWLEERIDPYYYKSEFINNYYKIKNIPNKKLGDIVYFSKETWNPRPPLGARRERSPSAARSERSQKAALQSEALQDYSREGCTAERSSAKFPYIEIGNILPESGDIKNVSEIKVSDAPSSAKMVVRENDIIISTTRPSRGAICLIDKRFDGCIASTGFAVIREVKDEILLDKRYLFYALRFDSTLKQFEQRSTGAIYPIITKTELKKVLIPFPSKDIQIQIISVLERAYALKKQKEAEITQKEAEVTQIVEKAKQEVKDLLLEKILRSEI